MKLNIGGITEAGRSVKNHTGTWRYQIPVIKKEKCNGCGICELFCPDSCIVISENLVSIDETYCKGCGICVRECSLEAIMMQPEGEV